MDNTNSIKLKHMKNFFKKIWNWIISIPQDKLLHDYAGALINLFTFSIFFRILGWMIVKPFWWAFLIGNVIALLALIGKEIYDSKHKEEGHSVEWKDILYGVFGIVKIDIALLIMLL